MLLVALFGSLGARGLLAGPSALDSKVARNVLEGKPEGYCSPSGPIESTHCLYETIESLNPRLFPVIHSLVETPFFRHYKVDLYRECPFWHDNGFCMNRDCGVEEADESQIPEKWRRQALSEVSVVPPDEGEGSVGGCYFREQDFCYIEDDATQEGQYVDLTLNPERFTGYAGDSSHQVWRAIYEENCFGLSEASLDSHSPPSPNRASRASAVVGAGSGAPSGGFGFSKLSEGWGTEMLKSQVSEGTCEEKKVYYRVISGLHASISIHICHEYLDQQTGEWAPNLPCFVSRLATHPERLSNVYFNAVLMLRAVERASKYLEAYDISTAPLGRLDELGKKKREEDVKAKGLLKEVLHLAGSEGMAHGFDEGDFFTGDDALILKEQFKTHFRNVSRIMDCVGCDKCRLWGKLQVSGLGTALKILFELDDKALDPKINPDLLQRSEVVALFNTLHRLLESLAAVENFRKMYAQAQSSESSTNAESQPTSKRRRKPKKVESSTMAETSSRTISASATLGLVVSALETFRRGCKGCLEVCWRQLEKGRMGHLVEIVKRWAEERVPGIMGRVEL
ncbi:endoplasmic oxidoreductin 1 [Tremella mesenterica]|uniref:Endoplasmic oxidoreductin 1 n=1 Tax=Tremella mesenterica TaxID=5217 RepID=A0A4V1M3E5_TREME|nr:endoplasmic oxidoreductin 1 [Tremella mesenterica]